jgi:DNA-binding IclR family transcriptional regulator
MIAQTPDGRYTLGMKLYECGCAVSGGWDVKEAARPYLEQLARQVGWGSYLALRSGDHVLTVDRCSGSTGAGLQLTVEPGIPLPLHATAQGKLFLSHLSDSDALQRLQRAGLQAYTPHTITDTGQLLHALEIIRRKGYAIEDGEYKIGLRSVAAPVYDRSGQVRYALGAVGLFRRISSDEFSHAVEQTVSYARQLSRALGSRP